MSQNVKIMAYIKNVDINGLWGMKNISWQDINEDVNIIVGINGSGKTSLLNILWGIIGPDFKNLKKYKYSQIEIKMSDGCIVKCLQSAPSTPADFETSSEFISTFDVISSKNSKTESPLSIELSDIIYTAGKNMNTFFDYRLKATNYPEQANLINNRIQSFYQLVNKQFFATNKQIGIEPSTNKIIFRQDGNVIHLEDLSSGEKQFLLIMFKVFLMEEKPHILLMDEPEISMHLDWQFELINVIRELNPNCQIIISTHSPSMFGDGWGDKVVYMEDILK